MYKRQVKYYTIKKYNILLPANFTIKNLGLDYSYISSAKRIHINKPGNSYLYTKNTTTNYNKKTSDYIKSQTVKSYGGKKINYNNYVPTSTDPTHGYQYPVSYTHLENGLYSHAETDGEFYRTV